MPEVLEVLHLPEEHGVAQVQVGRRRVEADLDGERATGVRRAFELGLQFGEPDDVDAALGEVGELLVEGHETDSIPAVGGGPGDGCGVSRTAGPRGHAAVRHKGVCWGRLSRGGSWCACSSGWTTAIFDALARRWESARQQRAAGTLIIVAYLASLAAIEFARQGWLPAWLGGLMPTNHFYAVDVAFTLLLFVEVIGLVFGLAESVARSLGIQFEIFSLILLRQTFKEFTRFDEPIRWEQVRASIVHMAQRRPGGRGDLRAARRLLPAAAPPAHHERGGARELRRRRRRRSRCC